MSRSGSSALHGVKFCPARWIEDHPVAERTVKIWLNLVKVINYWENLWKSKCPCQEKTLWPFFMDEVQLPQGYRATTRRQFTFFH